MGHIFHIPYTLLTERDPFGPTDIPNPLGGCNRLRGSKYRLTYQHLGKVCDEETYNYKLCHETE